MNRKKGKKIMIKKLKTLLISLATTATLVAPLAVPVAASAQGTGSDTVQSGLCSGSQLKIGADCDSTTNSEETKQKVNDLITQVINIFSVVVGVVSVIMIIIGGFKYITSGGDSGNVSGAKNTILYAIIGLIVVALSQLIVKFVLAKVGEVGSL